MMFQGLMGIITIALLVWLLYTNIKRNPELLSRNNLSQSLTTLGIMSLILITIIALVIYLLRQT